MKTNDTALVLIDLQEKLSSVMYNKAALVENSRRLVQGALALDVPILWLEHIPEKMGPSLPGLLELLSDRKPIAKTCFSCIDNPEFASGLAGLKRKNLLLAGIEAHVCVYQTARDLVAKGYSVEIVADAVSSRTEQNWNIALKRCEAIGAGITSVESALFELIGTSEHPRFRDILKIVK